MNTDTIESRKTINELMLATLKTAGYPPNKWEEFLMHASTIKANRDVYCESLLEAFCWLAHRRHGHAATDIAIFVDLGAKAVLRRVKAYDQRRADSRVA